MPNLWWLVTVFLWPVFIILALVFEEVSGEGQKQGTLSDLGSSGKYGPLFRVILIGGGLIQLGILSRYGRYDVGLVLLIITTICGILTGIVRRKGNQKLHDFIARLGFIVSSPGWILFGLSTKSYILLLLGSLIIPWVVLRGALGKKITFKHELLLFVGAFATNLVLVGLI